MNRFKQTTLITLLCLAFMAGLVFGRTAQVPVWTFTPLASVWLIGRRWRRLALIAIILLIGAWRAGQVTAHDRILSNQLGQTIQVSGTVADDPTNQDGRVTFALAADHLNGQPYQAKLQVSDPRQTIHRGYRLIASGKLKPGLGSYQAELSYPTIQLTSDRLNWLERLRLKFFAAERTVIPEPMASFALGLLVGARALIPKNLQAELAAVGLSHLIAVSGYNLTILINGASRLIRRGSKFLVFAASLWLIAGFVAVAGASPSIIRAAVVSVLILAAGYYGRTVKPVVLIALAAAITAGLNPHSIWSDLGWQLSFAAFAGILLLAPALTERFGSKRGALALIFEALSAYLLTLPIILHQFGKLPLIAPVINIIIMPLVPLAMLTGFVAGLVSMLMPALGGWMGWPTTQLLKFMLGLVDASSKFQPVNVAVSATFVITWYGAVALLVILLNRRRKPKLTWYNDAKAKDLDHVGSLKMAQY